MIINKFPKKDFHIFQDSMIKINFQTLNFNIFPTLYHYRNFQAQALTSFQLWVIKMFISAKWNKNLNQN